MNTSASTVGLSGVGELNFTFYSIMCSDFIYVNMYGM